MFVRYKLSGFGLKIELELEEIKPVLVSPQKPSAVVKVRVSRYDVLFESGVFAVQEAQTLVDGKPCDRARAQIGFKTAADSGASLIQSSLSCRKQISLNLVGVRAAKSLKSSGTWFRSHDAVQDAE